MLQKSSQRQKRSQFRLTRLDNFKGKFRVKDPAICPNCGLSANGLSSILEKFGLRTMLDDVVRVQSWCKACRKPSRKYQL